jgi:hydrogenase maturation protein HypF
MELEALAGQHHAEPLPFPASAVDNSRHVMDPIPLLVALGEQRAAGADVAELAARFHESVARTTVDLVDTVREATGIRDVALGGGVFQNVRLLSSVVAQLGDRGFRALIPRKLSPNDGAISYGQAAVAASLLAEDSSA